MNELRLLIIDDDEDSIAELREKIVEDHSNIVCEYCEFADAERQLSNFRPNLVVLDLLEGSPPDPNRPGLEVQDHIWKQGFRPIIIFSAEPCLSKIQHPLVKIIQKGRAGTAAVMREVEGFLPIMGAMKEAEDHIERKFAEALRDVAPQAYEIFNKDSDELVDTIKRASRRRLAAFMDLESDNGALAPWEIYLCPPVSQDTQLGDILKNSSSNCNDEHESAPEQSLDPSNYFVVLTPSCDLVNKGEQTPNVSNALVAQCISMQSFHASKSGLKKINKTKLEDRVVREVLTPGHFEHFIPFPEFSDRIPSMVADLRQLHLVPIGDIGENLAYERIASVDSPFREMIAWVYARVTGRPGLPTRDFNAWKREIINSIFV